MKRFAKITNYSKQLTFLFNKSWLFRAVFISIAFLVVAIVLSQIFVRSQILQFSFASNQTCINSLAILPNIQKKSSNDFTLESGNYIKILGYPIFSKQLCIKSKQIPKENAKSFASIALLGNPILKRNIQIKNSAR